MIRTNDCQTSFSHAPAKWRQVTRKGRRHKVWSKAVERLLSFIPLKGKTRNFGVLVPNITHWRNFCQKFCLAFGNTFLGFGPSQSMKENCGDFQLTKIGYCSLLCWFGTNFLLHVCSVLSGWQFSVTNGNNGGMYASAFMKLAEKKGGRVLPPNYFSIRAKTTTTSGVDIILVKCIPSSYILKHKIIMLQSRTDPMQNFP